MSKAEASENVKEYEDDLFSRNTLTWVYQGNKSVLAVKTAFFYENYEYHQELHNNTQTDSLINSQNKTKGIFARINYTTSFNHGFSISTGLNYDYDWVNSNNYNSIKTRNAFGAFAKMEKDFIERIKLSVLARTQFTDEDFLPIMPLMGINIKLLQNHDLYIRSSISRNYHLPTLNDLYWNPGGNDNLKPEDGYEVEAGLNYILSSGEKLILKTDLTFYATKVNNWIQWVDAGTTFWTPQNINKVFSRGFEYSFHLKGAAGKLDYLIYGQYAFTRTTNISQAAVERGSDDQQLIYIPEHAANVYLNAGLHGFSFDWHIHYVGDQNTIGAQLPDFMLHDLSLGKAFKFGKSSLNIRMKANNILNTPYQSVSNRAMPGRNYELLIKYMLNK
jgi:iron complex outermembrane receptor protein